jgi:polar amino acid transport system substrate-binding protein
MHTHRHWSHRPVIVALTLIATTAACGSSSKQAQPAGPTTTTTSAALFARLPAAIAARRELKVGSDIEYAPIEFFKEGTEEVQGLDYDVAQALGGKLGVKVAFVNDTDFAGIIGALQAGRFDIIMSAMNDTAERRGKGVDFIDYFSAGSSILVQKGNPKAIKGIDDLCGSKVAVQKGTTQDTDILTPEEPKCRTAGKALNVLRFEKDSDALQQVKIGRVAADLEDFPVAAYNAKTSGGGADFDVVAGQVGSVGLYGIAVPSSATQLRDVLQAALKAIIQDGTYDGILKQWGVTAGAVTAATVNGGS